MQITLSYEQQMELEKDIRQALDNLRAEADGLHQEFREADNLAEVRMGIGQDVENVQAGLNVFLGIVERLDDIDEEFSGSMADAERGKELRRIHARMVRGIVHRAESWSPAEFKANTRLLDMFWAV